MLALVVAALNAAEKIKEVGSYAGFAAIVGLAVLSVLYFGQARELKRLREWAGRAPERAAEMQQRVVADVQRRTAPSAAPAAPTVPPVQRPPASAPATAGGAAAAGAPAGAATAATGQPGAVPSPANGATRSAGQPVPAAAGAAAGAAAATGSAAAPPKEPAAPGTVPPAGQPTQALPAVGGASPRSPGPPVTPARAAATHAPAPGPAAPTSAPAAAPARAAGIPSTTLPPRTAAGAAAAARAADPGDRDADGRSPARVTLAIIGGVLVVVVLAVLLVTQVLGGNDSPTKPAPNTIAQPATSTPATSTPAAAPVNRAATTVFVQNGTRINGAARGAANRLETRGYKIGGTATAVDQTLGTTRVAYTQNHRREALDVAKLLGVAASNVTGAGPNDAVAGGNADVVVTIGLDKAQ